MPQESTWVVMAYKPDPKVLIEIDHMRRVLNMRPFNRKLRSCLKCSSEFESWGNGNRLCDYCIKSAHCHSDRIFDLAEPKNN